jgi:hypothetical protein
MTFRTIAVAVALMGMAGACQTIPREMTVAEYCANPKQANKDVCKINVEIDGQRKALASTDMKLSEARAIADSALAKAEQALAREDAMYCETRTINKTNVGTCAPGYKVVSCTQTRYTTRAGGPSILREINDEQCRFHDRVLEIAVRCCMAGAQAAPTETVATPAETETPPQPVS